MKQAFIYILASQRNGTLYTGVTTDLIRRVWQHKTRQTDGFSTRYGIHHLVYFEQHADISAAITREKQIKRWRRAWKVRLIEQRNPNWIDLYEAML